jgi:hypothetical protein
MKRTIIFFILVIVGVGFLGMGGYMVWTKVIHKNNNEVENLVRNISTHMVLPDEIPTVATVTDKEKLVGQKFFVNAENGDKVLIYPVASKAILFRPKINKIIDVTSVLSVGENKDKTMIVEPTITVEETKLP